MFKCIVNTTSKGNFTNSFDAASLYGSIPHSLGKEAAKYVLNNYPDELENLSANTSFSN